MPDSNAIFASVSSAGFGTAIGYVASALIQAHGQKKSRADEASVLVAAASELTDRLLKRNTDLAHVNAQLRHALGTLIDAVQTAQDNFNDLPPEIRQGKRSSIDVMAVLQAALNVASDVEF